MMRTAGEVQSFVDSVRSGGFPVPPGRSYPAPPQQPPVRVEALTANWCMAGEVVTVGNTYLVPGHEADRLEWVGKAKRV